MPDPSMRSTRLLADRYKLGQLLGEGGMAQVYRAQDRVLERAVAVKLMRDVTAGDTERARFAAEARTLASMASMSTTTTKRFTSFRRKTARSRR